MATTLTNKIASSALNGEVVEVSLDSSERANLPYLIIGSEVTSVNSGRKGTIVQVDTYGTTFKVAPNTQSSRFDGTSAGILSVGDEVSVSIV